MLHKVFMHKGARVESNHNPMIDIRVGGFENLLHRLNLLGVKGS